jgi:hypothetical protein
MFLKDPDAELDYRVDWSEAVPAGTSIVDSSWRVEPLEVGGVEVLAGPTDGSVAVARLRGGVPGRIYAVGNLVSFSDGSRDERSLVVRVEER